MTPLKSQSSGHPSLRLPISEIDFLLQVVLIFLLSIEVLLSAQLMALRDFGVIFSGLWMLAVVWFGASVAWRIIATQEMVAEQARDESVLAN